MGENDAKIQTSSKLGELSDEILEKYGPDCKIISFVSGGCKNYSYKIKNSLTNTIIEVTKVKGITLHHSNSEIINYDSIFQCVEDMEAKDKIVDSRIFERDLGGHVNVLKRKKIYRSVINKRRRLNNRTYPYGYDGEIYN